MQDHHWAIGKGLWAIGKAAHGSKLIAHKKC